MSNTETTANDLRFVAMLNGNVAVYRGYTRTGLRLSNHYGVWTAYWNERDITHTGERTEKCHPPTDYARLIHKHDELAKALMPVLNAPPKWAIHNRG